MKASLKVISLLLAAMLVTPLAGCKSAEEKAEDKYRQVQRAFGSGQIEKGRELLLELFEDYSETKFLAEIIDTARRMGEAQ